MARVLVGCEYSGVVRDAFAAAGHDAWSCDFLPTDRPGQHYQGDIADMLKQKWDLAIFHPPCTFLANSGVCWLTKDTTGVRHKEMEQGAAFFKSLLDADIPRICVENPIQHKYAQALIRTPYTQIIQPWMFGHLEQKATCLWLKNLPKLVATDNVKTEMMKLTSKERQRLHYLPPSADRWKIRSTTFSGIAAAMASQWGPLL